MKTVKIILLSLLTVVLLLVITFVIYLVANIQKPAENIEAIFGNGANKVLIATQGSDFKDLLLDELLDNLKEGDLYIKGIDISELDSIDSADWDAVILIHTIEKSRVPKVIDRFLKSANNDKLVVVMTSGSGNWKPKNDDIDVITSASKDEEITPIALDITSRLRNIIEKTIVEEIEIPIVESDSISNIPD